MRKVNGSATANLGLEGHNHVFSAMVVHDGGQGSECVKEISFSMKRTVEFRAVAVHDVGAMADVHFLCVFGGPWW